MKTTETSYYKMLLNREDTSKTEIFAAVHTTKIFCRLDCPCKKPLEKNVSFFDSVLESISYGYRECKICKPLSTKFMDASSYTYIQWLESIEDIPKSYKDHPISSEAELKEIQKNFEKIVGFSLAKYIRIKNTFALLQRTKIAQNKQDNIIQYNLINTPIGVMICCFTNKGLCLLEFIDRKMLLSELTKIIKITKGGFLLKASKQVTQLQNDINQYFTGNKSAFLTKLDPIGTEFQRQVWSVLQSIPYGRTKSYKEQAIDIGNPNSVRAVANANGMNKISILIPCHRVVGSDGKLTGYGGGLWRKKYLLELEAKYFGERYNFH